MNFDLHKHVICQRPEANDGLTTAEMVAPGHVHDKPRFNKKIKYLMSVYYFI